MIKIENAAGKLCHFKKRSYVRENSLFPIELCKQSSSDNKNRRSPMSRIIVCNRKTVRVEPVRFAPTLLTAERICRPAK